MSLSHMNASLLNIEMSLNNKTDAQILSELKVWVGKEREAVTHVLYHLREVEERQLYLNEADSLKEFCMKVLKYSRHEAQARIDAMRLLKIIPEIDADLDAGRLSLTVAAQTMSSFRKEDARRAAADENPLSEEEQKIVLADLMSASTREADRKLATHFPNQPQLERTKPVSETLTRIEFNANAAAMKKFDRLQAYYHHQTGGSWEKLFEILADHEIEKLDAPLRRAPGSVKQTSSVTRQTRAVTEVSRTGSATGQTRATEPPRTGSAAKQIHTHCVRQQTRYIPKQTHQEIWSNWERGCDHTLASAQRCGSRRNLQIDHIVEFAEGGTNARENLRLLCGPHNRYRSDRMEKIRREFMARAEYVREKCLEQILTPKRLN